MGEETYTTDKMGMPRGNKLTEIKCKFDTEASVNVVPLTTYQFLSLSEFYEERKPIGGYGHDKTILETYNGNLI